MDQTLRSSIQTSTFYYFLIVMFVISVSQLTTMTVIMFADISGKEHLVAASVIGPVLVGAFGIIRILTNMQLIVGEMDAKMLATNWGKEISSIPFGILKFVFSIAYFVANHLVIPTIPALLVE